MTLHTKPSIYSEVAEFLASQPSLEALADYTMSAELQAHIDRLLEKNREDGLTSDERIELEKILAVSHVMSLTKTRAQLRLQAR